VVSYFFFPLLKSSCEIRFMYFSHILPQVIVAVKCLYIYFQKFLLCLIGVDKQHKVCYDYEYMAKNILKGFVLESQINSQTSHHIEGLLVLARIIARDILTKRQHNTKKKNSKKVGAHKHWRVAGENLS